MKRLHKAFFFAVLTVMLGIGFSNGQNALAQLRFKGDPFKVVGQFSVRNMGNGSYQITDGRGRLVHLLPRGMKLPKDVPEYEAVRIPVKRVAVVTRQDVALINALHEIETVVAVSGEPSKWRIPYIQEGLVTGKVISVGGGMGLDFEKIVKSKPELILTWDESMVPMAQQLGIPVILTHTDRARNLETQLKFAHVLAPLFNRFEEAQVFEDKVLKRIQYVKEKVAQANKKPKVIWGDIFPGRILVEPGNSFHGEMVTLAGGQYLFDDLFGAS